MRFSLLHVSIIAKAVFILSLFYVGMNSIIAKHNNYPNIPKNHFIVNAKSTGLAYIDDLDDNLMPHKHALNFVGIIFMEFDEENLGKGNLRYDNIFTFNNTTNVCKLIVKARDKIITEEELHEKYLTNETKRMLLNAVDNICYEYDEPGENENEDNSFMWGIIFILQAMFFSLTMVSDVKNAKEFYDIEKGEKND